MCAAEPGYPPHCAILQRLFYYVRRVFSSKEAAMDAESIAGLVGLAIGLLVLVVLSVFESRTYRREHHGEGMMHHWLAEHHVLDRMRRRH
ncbi:hypothetical protein ATN79_05115 [Paraburkholderia caribensis]|jgi:hypothetical protein|nr:hypothetical protein ATN79_05115 [Paraburkholderia caribensis]